MLRSIAILCVLFAYGSQLENGLARTPPMGWMSWAKFMCEMDCDKHPNSCINENLYMEMADRLVEDGFAKAGYNSIHIDDCWMERKRDIYGQLVADKKRFPNGIEHLADYMHRRGLTFGIYEDYGIKTCAGFPGSYKYEKIDADAFAKWKVDYLKLDGCYIDTDLMPAGYAKMGARLNSTGRPIVYSCSWPAYLIDHPDKVDYDSIARICNLWRNFDDIGLSWKSIRSIIDYYDRNQDKYIPAQKPGQWHDPDMIIVGNEEITPDQARVQMTIWSIWSAPLIMSNELRNIAPVYKDILLNEAVIAVDQDPFGIMGRLVLNTTDVGVYVKPVVPNRNGYHSYAVAIFNRNENRSVALMVKLNRIGLTYPSGYMVQNLWTDERKGTMLPSDSYLANIEPTAVEFFKASLIE